MSKKVIINTLAVLFLFIFTNQVCAASSNNDFYDDVFYSVIIEDLNSRNVFGKSDRTLEHKVTNEELNTITYLKFDGREDNIKSFKDLNKLKSLNTLILEYYMSISELDISENKELNYLRIVNTNALHDIDFSNNTKLSTIDFVYVDLNSLDLRNCPNLTSISVTSGTDSGRLKYLDVRNSVGLYQIRIIGHDLEEVDLSENINLRGVQIISGNLEKINLPINSNISNLDLSRNNLRSIACIINIEKQNKLTQLVLSNNKITDANFFSKLPQNIKINLDGNNQNIILSKSDGGIKLPDIFIEEVKLNSFINENDVLDISTEGNVKVTQKANRILQYSNAKLGDKIIVKIKGNLIRNSSQNGICVTYEFLPKNDYFEDINLFKIIIDDLNARNVGGINKRDLDYEITEKELDTVTRLSINGLTGDKNFIEVNSLKGIENLKELETLEIKYQDIRELDISNNKKLKYVSIINANYLHDVDFSNNVELVSLNLANTHLESLDLKNCSNLNTLIMGAGLVDKRRLEFFDVSNCYNLKNINISGHLLEKIDLRNNINLKSVEITFGPLEEIILPKTSDIINLDLEYSDENLKITYEKSDVEIIEQPEIKKEKPILKFLLSII